MARVCRGRKVLCRRLPWTTSAREALEGRGPARRKAGSLAVAGCRCFRVHGRGRAAVWSRIDGDSRVPRRPGGRVHGRGASIVRLALDPQCARDLGEARGEAITPFACLCARGFRFASQLQRRWTQRDGFTQSERDTGFSHALLVSESVRIVRLGVRGRPRKLGLLAVASVVQLGRLEGSQHGSHCRLDALAVCGGDDFESREHR